MEISLSHRFVFVHVPKTGGDSMTAALRPLGTDGVWRTNRQKFKHATARAIRRQFLEPAQWRTFFSFGFVRNPWEWVQSKFHYNRMMHRHLVEHPEEVTPDIAAWVDDVARASQYSFAEFVAVHCGWLGEAGLYRRWLCDAHGRQLVKFVGRYERLAADWAQICERIGVELELPHHNETLVDGSPRPPYQEEYDDASRQLVAEAFASDIEIFGYRFA